MAEEEKVENGENQAKEEKKDNAFSKFFKKTKDSVNASILESKIEGAFEKAHTEYKVYSKDSVLGLAKSFSGSVENGVLTVFGEAEVANFSVVIAEDEKAYYVIGSAPATVKATVDGVEYERPGTDLTLDENVEEVNVVKAGDRYFIYKGETK